MTKFVLTAVALTLAFAACPQQSDAQNEVLAEMYGRGVHAFYAGDQVGAEEMLTMAIDNGIQDPRAYYFRGMVAHTAGRTDEAKTDWQTGAKMEAAGRANPAIGRSLSRFQGTGRLELESIRQRARLTALAESIKKSNARYGEIQQAEARVLRRPPTPAPAAASAAPAAAPKAAPAAAAEDPFADDMADGTASVQSDDALKDAMNDPFANAAAVPAGNVPANDTVNPFGGADAAASDPFAGGAAAEADPFGSSSPAPAADPFGTDSGGADMEADPFGGNPFDN